MPQEFAFNQNIFDQIITQFLNGVEQQPQGVSEEDLKRIPKTQINEQQVKNGIQCERANVCLCLQSIYIMYANAAAF